MPTKPDNDFRRHIFGRFRIVFGNFLYPWAGFKGEVRRLNMLSVSSGGYRSFSQSSRDFSTLIPFELCEQLGNFLYGFQS